MGYVLDLDEIDQSQFEAVGGKAANLAQLRRIEGTQVPDGFCVTTAAFRLILAQAPSIDGLLEQLARVKPSEQEAIRTLSVQIRQVLEAVPVPAELVAEIGAALSRLGEHAAYAVRSSGTAEDLPTASFAGQQDSYLNVLGGPSILEHLSRCWASLFTERAVSYRLHHGFDHRKVQLAVLVQRMILPDAAGVLFTADPVSSNRKISTVEAVLGLGEALVSGLANADVYQVAGDELITKTIASKDKAIRVHSAGGTVERPVAADLQDRPALTAAQAIRLVRLGRRVEAHFGCPQDIEWCLVEDGFHLVQSRPITTLFPIPETTDGENHVYLSVGHQQMMTDAMTPLGLSVWQLTTPRPMAEAGGRLFVDVTGRLASPASRAELLELMGKSDPLTRDAMQTVLDRGDFVRPAPDVDPGEPVAGGGAAPIETDPAIVTELIERNRASVAALKNDLRELSGPALLDFILADLGELRRLLFDPRSLQVIMAGMESTWWLNDHLQAWLGEKNAADPLTQSVPHNVTSEMGLALLDVADAIRPHPKVVEFLQHLEEDEHFLDELAAIPGGAAAREAVETFLDGYGMRCAGEIDLTRPRWSERPATLVPTILGNLKNSEAGAGKRRFEQGRQRAQQQERQVLMRLRALPDGEQKAAEAKRMIDRVRTFAGYREYPKYGMVSRYFVYKQALLREADRLVRAHALRERDDIYYLRYEELHELVRGNQVDGRLIAQRRKDFTSYQSLTPPRVLTSDGEVLTGAYRRADLPAGALAGLPVSAGTVEGRARIVVDMAHADLEAGDILVTAYTDPSWTPLFPTIAGLVTEVGGVMTHGAVIAREYGLPAVVAVPKATQLIRDGQRIRVHGTAGYVELLS